ncbi:MAG: hypothetical protein ACLFP4_05845 [Spirochaetales bacterium]
MRLHADSGMSRVDSICPRLVIWIGVVIGLAGCSSLDVRSYEHAGVHGLVLDYAGAPVSGALVQVGDLSVTSGADGTFHLADATELSFDLSVRRAHHLPYSGTIVRSLRAEVVVLRIASVSDVVRAIDQALSAADEEQAARWIADAEQEGLADARLTFLSAILAYRNNDFLTAGELLGEMEEPLPEAAMLLREKIQLAN